MGLTAALLATGIGLSALGTYQAGMAASQQAKAQAAVAEYNAKVKEQEAQARQVQAEYESRRQAEAATRRGSGLLANLGASGGIVSEGAPLMLQATQATEDELENLMIGVEGGMGVSRAYNAAALDRMQASIYNQRAGNARTGAFVGAGTTLLSGFGQGYARGYWG